MRKKRDYNAWSEIGAATQERADRIQVTFFSEMGSVHHDRDGGFMTWQGL